MEGRGIMNRTELVDVSAYHKISVNDNGVNYAMKVTDKGDGVWLCDGYALAGGVKIADWFYIAHSFGEATSDETKQYLYRELKASVMITLRGLYRVALLNGAGE